MSDPTPKRRGRPPKPRPQKPELPEDIRELLMARTRAKPTYGLFTPEEAARYSRAQIELAAFRDNPAEGLGRLEHFKNFAFERWVGLESTWNQWCDRMVGSLCREVDVLRVGDKVVRATVWAGAGSIGKTFTSALFALGWWLCDPHNSIAILTSTTKVMLRRRVWSCIRNFVDNMVDIQSMKRVEMIHPVQESQTMIQATYGDDLHAMFALPVAHGETASAISKMSGLHAKRMLLIVDECDGTPSAIFETIPNMIKGCREFTFLGIANPKSHLDNHGRLAEPKAGWSSIGVESDTWHTKGVPEWQIPSGICEHFDGYRSPNVLLGYTKYIHIYSYEDYQIAQADPERVKHMQHWAQDRGFWAGEGILNTIFTDGMLERYGGKGTVRWRETPVRLAFLDPAFGGDECKLVLGEVGIAESGEKVLQVVESLVIPVVGAPGEEAEFVIARETRAVCEARGVSPERFGVDSNGTGRGVAAVLAATWDSRIHKLDSCGPVSDLPVSGDDPTSCKDVYDRAVTEHWFLARQFLESGQLKGIYREAAIQFCSREFERKGKKYVLSTKVEAKATLGRSPDDADAIVGLCRLATEVAGIYPRGARTQARDLPDDLKWLMEPAEDAERPLYSQPQQTSGMYQ